ncbi:hypothetical protein [Sporosarcina sp. FSL W7-1283]|uniref:hypothetical protein n=1 Tax=Sporosarcina sp. FSL W7-1283 TaxID=2921560 RepID=UPI0030F7E5B2
MIKHITNQLILTAGAWNESGQKDKVLEWQFERQLFDLQLATGTNHEGAMEILLATIEEKELAA